MKQVLAIIRPQMMNATKEALIKAGISGFTARKVVGRGRGKVDYRVLHAAEGGTEEAIARLGDGPMLVPKRLINIVVPDEKLADVTQALITTNQTGAPGDGKIFVIPVTEAVRIRTGERDSTALKES